MMDKMGEAPREGAKMGGRRHRARGGSTTNEPVKGKEMVHEYNAVGAPEMDEAKNRTPAFRRGGKLKDGGMANGEMAHDRHDRAKRGSGVKLQRGGGARTPYSTGSQLSPPKDDRAGRGYEGDAA